MMPIPYAAAGRSSRVDVSAADPLYNTPMQTFRMEGSEIPIPIKEVYRYLGYRGIVQDEALDARVQACMDQLHARSVPRSIWTSYTFTPEEIQLTIGPLQFESRALSRNLRDCSEVVMMAATIGPGVDFLIRRAEATSMVDAAIYQAAGAAMVESWCDIVNERIREEARASGLYARPRFSPGYGDVPLALQTDFARVLNLAATCGISLSDSLLMTPSKSVTAFIGLGPTEERCPLAGCEVCNKATTCAYRR